MTASEPPSPGIGTYTVGWIAALPVERAAAVALLDEKHQTPKDFNKHQQDDNAYTWGRSGQHYVVVASLPAGTYGLVSAANTAGSMKFSLPHLRICFMVGIGAGIPRHRQDVRLGDVVVGIPAGNTPGVIQYDLGRLGRDGALDRVGALNRPPQVILNGVAKLQSEHLQNPPRINQIHEDMIKRSPYMAGEDVGPSYLYQGADNDRLFVATCNHIKSNSGEDECIKCDTSQIVHRPLRKRLLPRIFYGTIASGNMVVKDGIERDRILDSLDKTCICFEMEAAGLMNNFPCLVVRGICDYADSHKNKRWQPYAASTAAAYVKELLDCIDVPGVQETATLSDSLMHRSVDAMESNRHDGTGKWIFENKEYSRWCDGHSSCLWVQGLPGCGKSVLCASIVESLDEVDDGRIVLRYYFTFTESAKQTFENMVRTFIADLAHVNETNKEGLIGLHARHRSRRSEPSLTELCKFLSALMRQETSLWIILDALDECRLADLPETVNWIMTETTANLDLHILLTSRPELDIQTVIAKARSSCDMIQLDAMANRKDIESFTLARVKVGWRLQRWKAHPAIQDKIIGAIMKKADGMFRWVVCQLDQLERCLDQDSLDKALSDLPKDLETIYARILHAIPEQYYDKMVLVLRLLIYSNRPLSTDELADASAVRPTLTPAFKREYRMADPREIARYCSSLILVSDQGLDTTRRGKSVVRLAHASVKDFLMRYSMQGTASHPFAEMISTRAIAEVCIAYIRSIDARCTQSNINQENQYPFATFSGSNCLEYAVACQDQSGDFIRLVRDFLLSKRDFEVYGWLLQSAVPGNVSEDQLRKKDTPLTRTAFLGFDLVAKALIEAGEPFDAVGHSQFSALQEVVWNCSVDTVTMMLDRGADMDLGGGPYHTPIDTLSLAVQTGDLDKVNVLLQYGANVNGHERRPGQPLVCAIKMRHHTIVQLLLQWGPRTIGDFHGFQTALDLAIELGEYSNVTALQAVLLKEKGGVEHWHRLLRRAAFWGPGTLLDSLLAERGSEKKVILPLLLDLFACVFTLFFSADSLRKRSHIRPEALVLAVLAQAPDRVLALLRRGADPNIDSRWFGSALGAAAQKSDVEMVRLLLDYGARPSVRQPDFPLHQAILAADLAAVQLLVRNGADLELEAPDFGTPLMTAASLIVMVCRHEIFPESGFTVRLNETTLKPLEEERTPLEEVFHWLISMGADPNSANAHFKSVTHAIVQSGRPDLVKLLFEHDVVIHAEDLNAWLHAAVDAGSSSTLALLIGRISGVQKGDIHEALRQYRGPPETEEWHRLHRLLVLHDRLASGSPLMTWLRTFQSVSIDDLLDLPLDDDSWFNNYIAGFADDNPWRSMFSGRRRRKASAGWYPWREPQQLWASLARFM